MASNLQAMRCSICKQDLPEKAFDLADNKRGHFSYCRVCRSERYYRLRYEIPCSSCKLPRPLWKNGVCRTCNEAAGWRECRGCGQRLLPLMDFYGHQRVCKSCKRV